MYVPSQQMLKKYADVLIRFALNDGEGIRPGETVYFVTQTPGIPLAVEVYRSILQAGGNPLVHVTDDRFRLIQVQEGSDEQIRFFPASYYRGLADQIDHYVRILADEDPLYLKDVDPKKVIASIRSTKQFRDWLDAKEDAGKFSWTLCLYATEGAAREAGLSVEEYWNQIRNACFLDEDDPIAKWRNVVGHMSSILDTLNDMTIDKVHVEAKDTDLWVGIGEKRRWLGGRGRNIPSFEIFTSPDWRQVDGKVFFDLPLYRYGNIIRDIHLELKDGKIINARAGENESLLREMISQKHADRIGEFSLTDRRFSRITKFMANTLYDENFGGEYGNTHLAVGKAYHDACSEPLGSMTEERFKELGFNDSPEHTDIIATGDRKVTAVLKDGGRKVIYEGGEFQI
ncbi:MAG: aminopeptidase [Chitinispirillaceae bacterium]